MSQATDSPGPASYDVCQILLASTGLTPEQLDAARDEQAEKGGRVVDHLLSAGHVSSDELLAAWSRQLDLVVRPQIRAEDVDDELIEKIPIAFAKNHGIVPLRRDADGIVYIATSNPMETDPLDDLRLIFEGAEIQLELANQRTILGAINEAYDRGPGSTDALAEDAAGDLDFLTSEFSSEPEDLLDAADDAPIIKLVNSLLQHAVKERASDVHLEPSESEIRVRFRIDDVLYEPIKPLPSALHASIVSRIKIMGGLNIAEKRLPQDGRIRLKIAGRDYDVRLSTLPIAYGERVVMRLLPRTQEMLDLEKIGFGKEQLRALNRLIARPNGIILVTGPTGSGKTTTLYGALSRINATDKNIITIEDPVEIQLKGIGQIEVGAASGPERDPGRRDPRCRNRRDCDPGLAHRPPRVLDTAHQRCAQRDHPPRRHGRRTIPRGLVSRRRARATARACAVHRMPRSLRGK
ncbi:MAG: Flp pilus assembly complex ATPase component TadA [Deltaproteobacteria bacterium]|nr:Flp pilus assembly complex ATPase component TadA [Deltaproteobacteria bacterium]